MSKANQSGFCDHCSIVVKWGLSYTPDVIIGYNYCPKCKREYGAYEKFKYCQNSRSVCLDCYPCCCISAPYWTPAENPEAIVGEILWVTQ